jgi:hypothetical protein
VSQKFPQQKRTSGRRVINTSSQLIRGENIPITRHIFGVKDFRRKQTFFDDKKIPLFEHRKFDRQVSSTPLLSVILERRNMSPSAKEYPLQYFAASALASSLGYPLWRAAAIGQSGFNMHAIHIGRLEVPRAVTPYVYGFLPPYKGMVATVFGMTWARYVERCTLSLSINCVLIHILFFQSRYFLDE